MWTGIQRFIRQWTVAVMRDSSAQRFQRFWETMYVGAPASIKFQLQTRAWQGTSVAKGEVELRNLGTAIAAIIVVLAGFLFYQKREADREKKEAELTLGLDASRMINVTFQRRAELTVSKLSGDVVAQADCQGRLFHPTQRTKAPASVGYTINLKAVGPSAYTWNLKEKILTIDIPDVHVEPPNIDAAAQIVRQDGVFISRQCGLVLARKTASRLSARASAEATKPENLKRAREAARDAISSFARGTLNAAGLSGVSLAVRLPGEQVRVSTNSEHWDETRPLLEVLNSNGR